MIRSFILLVVGVFILASLPLPSPAQGLLAFLWGAFMGHLALNTEERRR